MIGCADVNVQYKSQYSTLPILVLEGEGPNLFGCNWLRHIQIDWKGIYKVEEDRLHTTLVRHEKIFQEGLGRVKDFKAKIHVDSDATPRFFKAHPVPYSMKGRIGQTTVVGNFKTCTIHRVGRTNCTCTEIGPFRKNLW